MAATGEQPWGLGVLHAVPPWAVLEDMCLILMGGPTEEQDEAVRAPCLRTRAHKAAMDSLVFDNCWLLILALQALG